MDATITFLARDKTDAFVLHTFAWSPSVSLPSSCGKGSAWHKIYKGFTESKSFSKELCLRLPSDLYSHCHSSHDYAIEATSDMWCNRPAWAPSRPRRPRRAALPSSSCPQATPLASLPCLRSSRFLAKVPEERKNNVVMMGCSFSSLYR